MARITLAGLGVLLTRLISFWYQGAPGAMGAPGPAGATGDRVSVHFPGLATLWANSSI